MAEDAIISNLVDWLTELLKAGISPILRVREQVESLRQELKAIRCFMEDMDWKQRHEITVKNWLNSFRDVAYEAEDLIESFMIEGQRYAPFRAPNVYHSYGKQIEQIRSKIRDIARHRENYVSKLPDPRGKGSCSGSTVDCIWRRSSPQIGVGTDDRIVGFEHDVEVLMERLLDKEAGQVIAITGMGGIGKTTLATLVYNLACDLLVRDIARYTHLKESTSQSEARKHFELCAWVPVGQEPHVSSLLWTIMSQASGHSQPDLLLLEGIDTYEVWPVQVKTRVTKRLFELLGDKRYLIVLDDVWSTDVWNLLREALPDLGNGSRIILTTRSLDVAKSGNVACIHEPKPLTDEDSWQLFLTKVFPQKNRQDISRCPEELEALGHQLSKSCCGLPLALVVLGGLVSRKEKHPAVWSNLLKSLNWDSTKDGRQCLDILALSFYDLPYYVKLCFLYFGAFKLESEINVSKLIKLWVGDGLVVQQEGKTKEETAADNLEELIQRCLVQIVRRGSDRSIKRVRVHGIISELAISVARETQFLHVVKNSFDVEEGPQDINHRRLVLHRDNVHLSSFGCVEKLRVMLVFPQGTEYSINIGGYVHKPLRFFQRWTYKLFTLKNVISYQTKTSAQYIRVLELEGGQFPGGFLEFLRTSTTHLRYLGLRNTNLREFPFFTSNLQSLQTLDIRGTSIQKLPDVIWTLKTLHHLYLNSMQPPGINGLKSLQTLSGALCPDWIARNLGVLTNLRNLNIMVKNCGSGLIDSLRRLSNLTSFKLSGEPRRLALSQGQNSFAYAAEKIPQEVIAATASHNRLYKLKLVGELYPNELPAVEQFACYLTEITLCGSHLEGNPMQTLEQLRSLRVLKLKDNACCCEEISCSHGGFPELQSLKLSNMSFLNSLKVNRGALHKLVRLSLHRCLDDVNSVIDGLEQVATLRALKLKGVRRLHYHIQIVNLLQRGQVSLV